jgi:hypothetical protein
MRTTSMSMVRLGGAAVALVAAAGGTLVTAPAQASTATAPDPSSISIRTLRASVAPGATDTVTGDLAVGGGSAAGRSVTLQAHTPGQSGYVPVGSVASGANGGLSLQVTPEISTLYRWHYDGATDARPSSSGVVRVDVTAGQHHGNRLGTTLSVRALHRVVGPDGFATVRGRLRSGRTGLPNRQVQLLAHRVGEGEWHFVTAQPTGGRGAISFRVSPDQPTRYRMQFLGSQVFRPTHSGVVTIAVRTAVSISAVPGSIAPGQVTTISATATHRGLAVQGATAQLLARAAHPYTRFHVVGSGTTGANGGVSLAATPAHDTRYEVRVLPSTSAPGGLSPATQVDVTAATSLSVRGRDAAHGRYSVSGSLRSHGHPVRHVRVTLWSQAPGSTVWTEVAHRSTSRHGSVRFLRPQVAGTGYRLTFAGNHRYAAAASGTVVD